MAKPHLVACARCKQCDLPVWDETITKDECHHHWYLRKVKEEEQDAECMICCSIMVPLGIQAKCCKKRFCRVCIIEWLLRMKEEATCPNCRASMASSYVHLQKLKEQNHANPIASSSFCQ